MSVYDKPGNVLSIAYGLGSVLSHAYAVDGTEIFPDEPPTPVAFKTMSYNVGSWTAFGQKATAANQDFWYGVQNAIFTANPVGLCGIQEYYSKIYSYNVPTMLAQYFTSMYAVDRGSKAGRALCSDFPLSNGQEITFVNQDERDEIRSYLIGDVVIGGKTVKFLTAHLSLYTNAIIGEIQELLSAVANYDYWILTGDFNIAFPDAQSSGYTNLVKPFLDAGYHVANGSTFGFIPTFSTKSPGDDSDWRVLDNIMCSANIDITDVYVDTTKLTMLTTQGIDHLPLIAEMELL